MRSLFITLLLVVLSAGALVAQPRSVRRSHETWRDEYRGLNKREADYSVLSLHLRHPGELASHITDQDRQTVTSLILDGAINDADIRVIAELGRRAKVRQNDKEVNAYLNLDLENVRYFSGDRLSDRLPSYAFRGCTTLRSVVLPFRITELGTGLFDGCSKLEVVAVPDNLEVIGERAFYGCSELRSMYVPDYVTTIPDLAFYGCSSLTRVSLPEGLTTIGREAFRNTGLTGIDLPSSVETIGNSAFAHSRIRKAFIPATVTQCSLSAFMSGMLAEYEVEDGQPQYCSIDGMLYDASGTELLDCPSGRGGRVVIPAQTERIRNGALSGCSFSEVVFECAIADLGSGTFSNCGLLQQVTLPEGLTSIGSQMFHECGNLTHVDVPASVQVIGAEAFRGCRSLAELQLPPSVQRIANEAFRACKGLTHIDLPEGLTTIGEKAFDYCTHLQALTLPSTVNLVGEKAFYNCDRLMRIEVLAPRPPQAADKVGDNLKKVILIVPAGTSSDYRSAPGWSKYKNIQEN